MLIACKQILKEEGILINNFIIPIPNYNHNPNPKLNLNLNQFGHIDSIEAKQILREVLILSNGFNLIIIINPNLNFNRLEYFDSMQTDLTGRGNSGVYSRGLR
jgi:hypothetical protein